MQFRLLPIITFACLVLLIVKVADLVQGGSRYSDFFLVSPLKAEDAKPADDKGTSDVKPTDKDSKDSVEKKPDVKDTKDAKDAADNIKDSGDSDDKSVKKEYSDTELQILSRLAKRREELDAREKQLQEKEDLLNLSEKKIDDKMDELKNLKSEVEAILAQYNEKEDAKLTSLAKIYETMKPKSAAEIFDKMDTNTLLLVISKMKESKTAPVLAAMDPTKAKEVSVDYLKQKKLPEEKQKAAKEKL
jgi:flagellar motility protein MotE (MotC chaperone)